MVPIEASCADDTVSDVPLPWSLSRLVLTPILVLVGLAIGAAGVLAIAFGRTELSGWGWLWSIEALVLGVALLGAPLEGRRVRMLRIGSAVALLSLVLVRIAIRGEGEGVSLVVLDREGHVRSSARWLDRLFEERDASVVGSRVLVALEAVPSREFPTLPALLASAYDELGDDVSHAGTPVPSTLIGLQDPDTSDALVVEPHQAEASLGVVFLHGYGGSFALQCLEVARALRELPAPTVCPATSFDGGWWRPEGQDVARAAISYLRARGAERIVLVGLSNGARGAALLAPRLRGEIDALVLLSGTARDAPTPPVPTLVVQGSRDTMMTTSRVRAWARGRARVRYVEIPGTHFVLLEEREAVARALREFVSRVG